MPALRRALESLAGGEKASRAKLVSTYFETAERDLARRGLVLRVRERDGHFVQTVKSEGASSADSPNGQASNGETADGAAATLLARGEWEDEIAAPRPDPKAPESGGFLEPEIADRLSPVFRTEVTRETLELSPAPDTRIEAAIDRGRICAAGGDAARRISEIELELKHGPVTALYDTALRLLGAAPLRVERRSKAERGYELASGKSGTPAAAKAGPLDLDPSLSAEEALRRIAGSCLDQLLRNEPAVIAGRPDGVHQMRVAARRLRAALSAFRDLLPELQRRGLSDELRWLADILGEARNLDVFKSAVLRPARAVADAKQLRPLAAAAKARHHEAYAAARLALRSPRYTVLILTLLRWLDSRAWRDGEPASAWQQPIGEFAPAALERSRRAIKKRRRGFRRQTPEERHQLRIALKKLRYTGELFGTLFRPRLTARFTERLKRLQDDLGDANDVRVAQDIVAELARGANAAPIAAAGRAVLDWHAQRLAGNDKKIRKRLRRLVDAEPFWRD